MTLEEEARMEMLEDRVDFLVQVLHDTFLKHFPDHVRGRLADYNETPLA